jgi:DNA modification methylase
VADLIRDCSRRNGIILDPFGGSGTTMLAAERTGRRARLIELDPLYVDVAIRRWEALTGKKTIHVSSRRTFGDLEEERASKEAAPVLRN